MTEGEQAAFNAAVVEALEAIRNAIEYHKDMSRSDQIFVANTVANVRTLHEDAGLDAAAEGVQS